MIDGSARKADIDTMCQRATLGLGKLGKAEPQVRLDDMATLRNGEPEDSGNDFRKSFAHGHRQILHRPNHTDPELGKENVHFCLRPAWDALLQGLVAVVAPGILLRHATNDGLDLAVHRLGVLFGVACKRFIPLHSLNAPAVAASHAPDEEAISLELMRDTHRKRHRVGRPAEKVGPDALPLEGT